MAKSKKGIVYILTNHYMHGLVKIGRTGNLPKRLGTLNTAVPQDFEVRCAVEAPDAAKLESDMHQAFKAQGVGRKTSKRLPEFFRIPFEHAVSTMELMERLIPGVKIVSHDHKVAGADGLQDEDEPSGVVDEKAASVQDELRSGRISFKELGVPRKATLVLVGSPDIEAVVASDNEVKYKGERMSLSKAARLAKKYSYGISGVEYWKYEGEILSARRKRIKAERKNDEADGADSE